jgi:putative multicomponent Na+:H+ antiporter subunit B
MCWHIVLVAMITMNDSYIYVITALLPLSALMLVLQVNPYNALVVQGILGAVAALVFAVLGAADVALTQALMGTLLAITLYAIAVRSSLVMRLGVLEDESQEVDADLKSPGDFGQLLENLRRIFSKYYLRLELVPYMNIQALQQALMDKEVHATCVRSDKNNSLSGEERQIYHTTTRVQRLYDIMESELLSPATIVTYVNTPDSGEKH